MVIVSAKEVESEIVTGNPKSESTYIQACCSSRLPEDTDLHNLDSCCSAASGGKEPRYSTIYNRNFHRAIHTSKLESAVSAPPVMDGVDRPQLFSMQPNLCAASASQRHSGKLNDAFYHCNHQKRRATRLQFAVILAEDHFFKPLCQDVIDLLRPLP